MSQRWATHRSPRYEPAENGYIRRVVFCNTEYFAYPTAERSYGSCKLHKGVTSYDRCLSCADNDGTSDFRHEAIPEPAAQACIYRDIAYDARRGGCKVCLERTECINKSLKKKFKLRVIK